jgi:hypothetical protein
MDLQRPMEVHRIGETEDMIHGVLFGSGRHLWPFPTESLHE